MYTFLFTKLSNKNVLGKGLFTSNSLISFLAILIVCKGTIEVHFVDHVVIDLNTIYGQCKTRSLNKNIQSDLGYTMSIFLYEKQTSTEKREALECQCSSLFNRVN